MKLDTSNCSHDEMVEQIVDLSGERHDETFVVRVPGMVCSACGFATITNRQSGAFTQAVSDAYREAHGLLTGGEIRTLRGRLGMSQIDFAEHLGVGAASIKRWESGKIQEKAMDALIRLKADPKAALRNAHDLNADLRFVECVSAVQVYRHQSEMALDRSGLDDCDVFEGQDVVAA